MAQITYTIPNDKLTEFKRGFLREHPNTPPNETGGITYTDNEWIREWGKRMFFSAYRYGKRKILAEGDAGIDEDIIG